MRSTLSITAAISALLLLGISCKSKIGSVNVNTNAVAQTAVNAAGAAAKDAAIAAAKSIYAAEEAKGVDFSKGPCLSNVVLPDWVADIAHNPRQAVDDKPENQCFSYREGKAHHFVELDTAGNLIRAE